MSEQIDSGTNRSRDDIEIDFYPENYVFPDCMIGDAWITLCNDGTGKKPSISQMRKEIEETTAPDGKILWDEEYYWWEETSSLEHRLEAMRKYLSSGWRSYTPSRKEWYIEREAETQRQKLLMQAEQLGIDRVKEKIFTESELQIRIDQLTGTDAYKGEGYQKLMSLYLAHREAEARESNGATTQSSSAGNGQPQAPDGQEGNE